MYGPLRRPDHQTNCVTLSRPVFAYSEGCRNQKWGAIICCQWKNHDKADKYEFLNKNPHLQFQNIRFRRVVVILKSLMKINFKFNCSQLFTIKVFKNSLTTIITKIMCHKAKCKTCAKWTWAGCGQHIKQALAGVPVRNVEGKHLTMRPMLMCVQIVSCKTCLLTFLSGSRTL